MPCSHCLRRISCFGSPVKNIKCDCKTLHDCTVFVCVLAKIFPNASDSSSPFFLNINGFLSRASPSTPHPQLFPAYHPHLTPPDLTFHPLQPSLQLTERVVKMPFTSILCRPCATRLVRCAKPSSDFSCVLGGTFCLLTSIFGVAFLCIIALLIQNDYKCIPIKVYGLRVVV